MTFGENKVIPEWVTDKEVISELLTYLKFHGSVPYRYLVNPAQTPEQQERMKKIVNLMVKQELIHPVKNEKDNLILAETGIYASRMGYRKFSKKYKRKLLDELLAHIIPVILLLLAAAGLVMLIIFMIHKFR